MSNQQIRSQNVKPGSFSFSADNVGRYRQLFHFLPHKKSDTAVYTHLFLVAQIQTQLSDVEDSVVGNAEQLDSLSTVPLLTSAHERCFPLTRLRCPGLFLLPTPSKVLSQEPPVAPWAVHTALCPTWELLRAIQNKN